MIRIETIAEFDEEGRFTRKCQLPLTIPPGKYDVVVTVDETVLSPEEAANFQSSITVIDN